MATARVYVQDHGMKRLAREFKAAGKGGIVSVGIQGDKAEEAHKDETGEGDMTNVRLGAIHEFGGGNVPERSHWRAVFDQNKARYRDELDRIAREFTTVAKARGDVRMIGEAYKKEVIDYCLAGIEGKGGAEARILKITGQYQDSFSVEMQK